MARAVYHMFIVATVFLNVGQAVRINFEEGLDLANDFMNDGTVIANTYEWTYSCIYQLDGLAQDLETFASFVNLSTHGKKRLLFVGDSLMGNFYEAILCGIERSGVKTNKTFMGVYNWNGQIEACKECRCNITFPDSQGSLQRFDFESDGDLASLLFFRFYNFGVQAGDPCTTSMKVIHDISNTYAADHVFFNHAHHVGTGPAELSELWKMVGPSMSQWAHATGNHASFLVHPPSHFAWQAGDFPGLDAPPQDHECSCKIPEPQLKEQNKYVSNRIGASYAEEYGFDVIDYWESMKSHCDKHPGKGDCWHYLLLPDVYAPALRQVLDVLKKYTVSPRYSGRIIDIPSA